MLRDVALVGGAVYKRGSSLNWQVGGLTYEHLSVFDVIFWFAYLLLTFYASGRVGLISLTLMEPNLRK